MIRKKQELRVEGDSKGKGGPATEKDLDLVTVVLVRGTKSSRLSKKRRGRRDEAEVGSPMLSHRYLGAIHIWALRTIRRPLHSMPVEIGSHRRPITSNVA